MPSEKVRQACGSRSTSRTRWPSSASAAPIEATVVVLATPPFWLATASVVRHRVPSCRTDLLGSWATAGLLCRMSWRPPPRRPRHRPHRRDRARLRPPARRPRLRPRPGGPRPRAARARSPRSCAHDPRRRQRGAASPTSSTAPSWPWSRSVSPTTSGRSTCWSTTPASASSAGSSTTPSTQEQADARRPGDRRDAADARRARRRWSRAGRGGIINVSSVAAFLPRGTYSAAKAWVNTLRRVGRPRVPAPAGVHRDDAVPRLHQDRVPRADGRPPRRGAAFLWLDVGPRRRRRARRLGRRQGLSIPSKRYKAIAGASRHVPTGRAPAVPVDGAPLTVPTRRAYSRRRACLPSVSSPLWRRNLLSGRSRPGYVVRASRRSCCS